MIKHLSYIMMIIIIVTSCTEDPIIETGTTSSQDYMIAEKIFNDVGRIVEDAFIDNGEGKGCPSYTLLNSDSSNQDTIIADFGDGNPANCLSYGQLRKGKIIMIYTGKYRDSLSTITATFDHYYVNNRWIQGKYILTNNGRGPNGNFTFDVKIQNAIITGNSANSNISGTINFNSSRTREWISGYNTFGNPFDDKYLVRGTAFGNSTNGKDFEVIITEDLYIDLSCLTTNNCVITSGKAELTPLGYSKRSINYGDSICDCNAIITMNEDDYPVIIN